MKYFFEKIHLTYQVYIYSKDLQSGNLLQIVFFDAIFVEQSKKLVFC
jgi:hypothetical protein